VTAQREQGGRRGLGVSGVPGVTAELHSTDDGAFALVVRADTPLRALTSAVVGEGFVDARVVVNRQVSKRYDADDAEAEMRAFMARHPFVAAADAIGLLTAAHVRDFGYGEHPIADGRRVAAWATVGLGNAARAGRRSPPAGGLFPGTINTIAVIDGDPSPGAFVAAAVVAAEAKAAALQALGVRDDDDGGIATGTTTDAVVVAATRRGPPVRYAGTATLVGHAVGRAVYDAVRAAAEREFAAASADESPNEERCGTER